MKGKSIFIYKARRNAKPRKRRRRRLDLNVIVARSMFYRCQSKCVNNNRCSVAGKKEVYLFLIRVIFNFANFACLTKQISDLAQVRKRRGRVKPFYYFFSAKIRLETTGPALFYLHGI